MANIVSWVSDRLHGILGLSDRYTAEFLVELARKSNSTDKFVQKLKDTGALEVNQPVEAFARELWGRLPQKAAAEKPARVKEREALLQQQRNRRYKLLSDSDGEDEPKVKQKSSGKKRAEKVTRSRKNLRQQSGWESESEEEKPSTAKRGKNDSDSDEWEQ